MKKDEQNKYGKFDTAEALFEAYNALEAQFTKRCQLVAELQAALRASAQAEKHAELDRSDETPADADAEAVGNTDDVSVAAPAVAEKSAVESDEGAPETGRQALTDEARQSGLAFDAVVNEVSANAEEYAEALSTVPEIFDACIALYKQRRIGGGLSSLPHGTAVLTPVKRPATLAEAKALTDYMLKR